MNTRLLAVRTMRLRTQANCAGRAACLLSSGSPSHTGALTASAAANTGIARGSPARLLARRWCTTAAASGPAAGAAGADADATSAPFAEVPPSSAAAANDIGANNTVEEHYAFWAPLRAALGQSVFAAADPSSGSGGPSPDVTAVAAAAAGAGSGSANATVAGLGADAFKVKLAPYLRGALAPGNLASTGTLSGTNQPDLRDAPVRIGRVAAPLASAPALIESMLVFIATGFDIVGLDVTGPNSGVFHLIHRRNFLGWRPRGPAEAIGSEAFSVPFTLELSLEPAAPRPDSSDSVKAAEAGAAAGLVATSPARAVQASGALLSRRMRRVHLDMDLHAALKAQGCPQEVLSCVTNPDAVKMVVALRTARVKPDVISWRALVSATKPTDTWARALGVL